MAFPFPRGGLGGAITWTVKVLRVLAALAQRAASDPRLAQMARSIPETRAATLVLYDDYGNQLAACITVSPEGVAVTRGECSRPNNRITMHINVMLDILEGRVDFRQAVSHGAVTIESLDGRPWFYHFVVWSNALDLIVSAGRG